jgi:hypothetical protein
MFVLLLCHPAAPLADTPAGVSGAGTPVHEDAPVVLRTAATNADRDRVQAKLASAEKALPKPSSTFRLEAEGEERGVGKDFGALDEPGRFNPIEAWTSRVYETRTASEADERTLEVHLALNGEHGLSTGLASVGGEARIVPMKGALAIRQTIIGADEGSRVALPLSDEDSRRAPTLVRIYVVPPELESRLRRTVEETGQLPRLDATHVSAGRPDAATVIVVELLGEARDVDTLTPKVPVASLRKLLTP